MLATQFWSPGRIALWLGAGGFFVLVSLLLGLNALTMRRTKWWESPADWPEAQTGWRNFRRSLQAKSGPWFVVCFCLAGLVILMTLGGGGSGGGG